MFGTHYNHPFYKSNVPTIKASTYPIRSTYNKKSLSDNPEKTDDKPIFVRDRDGRRHLLSGESKKRWIEEKEKLKLKKTQDSIFDSLTKKLDKPTAFDDPIIQSDEEVEEVEKPHDFTKKTKSVAIDESVDSALDESRETGGVEEPLPVSNVAVEEGIDAENEHGEPNEIENEEDIWRNL